MTEISKIQIKFGAEAMIWSPEREWNVEILKPERRVEVEAKRRVEVGDRAEIKIIQFDLKILNDGSISIGPGPGPLPHANIFVQIL